ncbi:MAG: hypothetical protein AB2689_09805 [Candidatus Thiodiazotropha taylori]
MNRETHIDRPELAIQSWQKQKTFYRENKALLEVVEYILSENLNNRLHASNSHHLLNISPRHRWNAKVHVLRIGYEGDKAMIELFSPLGELATTESVTPKELLEKVKNLIEFLLNEYELY